MTRKAYYCWLVYCWSLVGARRNRTTTIGTTWPLPPMDSDPDYQEYVYDSYDYYRYRNRVLNLTTTMEPPPPCTAPVPPTASLCVNMYPPGCSLEPQQTVPNYKINHFWFTFMDGAWPPFPEDLHIFVVGKSANYSYRALVLQVRINNIPVGKLRHAYDTVLVNCVPGVNNTLVYNGYHKITFKIFNWVPPDWYNITHPHWTPVIHATVIKRPGVYWLVETEVKPYKPTINPNVKRVTPALETQYDTKFDYMTMSRTLYDELKKEREEEEEEAAENKKTKKTIWT